MIAKRHLPSRGAALAGFSLTILLCGCAASHQPTANPSPRGSGSAINWPDYPRQALLNKWQGTVILRVVVESDGQPSSVEVSQSSGYAVLDDAAKATVSRWTFNSKGGTFMVPFEFRLPK